MKNLVDKREKRKVEVSLNSYCFKPFNADVHIVGVKQIAGLPKI
jgi:hypothetical protein